MPWHRWQVARTRVRSHARSTWDSWWTKWHWDRLGLPLSTTLRPCSILIRWTYHAANIKPYRLTECYNNTQELVITKYKKKRTGNLVLANTNHPGILFEGLRKTMKNSLLKISVITNGKCQTFLGDTAKNYGQWQHATQRYWCCTSRNYKLKFQYCNLPEITSSVFNLDELPVRSIRKSCHTPVH